MSRVYSVPHYVNNARHFFEVLSADPGSALEVETRMGAVRARLESVSKDDDSQAAAELDAAYGLGLTINPIRMEQYRSVLTRFLHNIRASRKRVITDDVAAFQLLSDCIQGRIGVDPPWVGEWCAWDKASEDVATCGLTASFCSPARTQDFNRKIAGYSRLVERNRNLANCMAAAETWRLGVLTGESRSALDKASFNDDVDDIEPFRITKGGWASCYEGTAAYAVGPLMFVYAGDYVAILDHVTRAELSDTLWTVGGWLLYAMNYRGGGDDLTEAAIHAAEDSVAYIASAIDACHYDSALTEKIGRHMKTAYAAALARYRLADEDPGAAQLAREQVRLLRIAADAEQGPYASWDDIIKNWDDRIAVDIGTAWNLLPGVDINPRALANSMKTKMNSERNVDEGAWNDFYKYSRGVITAHIITANTGIQGTWENAPRDVDPEDLEWVKSCRRGVLCYPPRSSSAWLSRCFAYTDHMSQWFWKADDVTHVSASLEKYATREDIKDIPRWEMNELLYALKMAPLLSSGVSPEQARDAFERGTRDSPCVMLIAGKNENTKPSKSKRETGSGDDITRELLSEADSNFGKIGHSINGVANRAGRQSLESRMSKLVSVSNSEVMLIALDIEGWSPNAPRKHHFAFMDLLLGFYKVPETATISSVFSDVHAVLSKGGFHEVYELLDGTIQGWTGMGDSILHSLIAQWSFVAAREAGHFAKESVIQKLTLIDDILMRLNTTGVDAQAAFNAIKDGYLKLGYKPDAVKTICSTFKGHFLNRLYAHSFEVLTAAKIFAKANRTYERKYAGVWSLIDSVFAGYLGASDRGAPASVCYRLAIWRSLTILGRSGLRPDEVNVEYATTVAWVPRALGGHGFPIYAQWVTRESADSLSSGLGAVCTIARVMRNANSALSAAIMSLLAAYTGQLLERRSAVATADDPFGISVAGLPDPESVGRSVAKKVANRFIASPVLRSMWDSTSAEGYERVLESFLIARAWPAPLVAGMAAALPHAVIRTLVARIESSDAILSMAQSADRHQAALDLRRKNRDAVGWWRRVVAPPAADGVDNMLGSSIAHDLRVRSLAESGYNMSYLESASSLDIMGMAMDDGHIKVIIPATTNRTVYEGVGAQMKVRTKVTSPIFEIDDAMSPAVDPVTKAIRTASCVVAAAEHIAKCGRDFANLFAAVWVGTGNKINFRQVAVVGGNPHRVAGKLNRRTYTVAAQPNSSASVIINANSAIEQFEETALSVDWMAIVFSLRASAAVEMEMGNTARSGEVREYVLRASRVLVSSDNLGPPAGDDYLASFAGVGCEKSTFEAKCASEFAMLQPGVDTADDTPDVCGILGLNLPQVQVHMTARQIMRAFQLSAVLRDAGTFPLMGFGVEPRAETTKVAADVAAVPPARLPREVVGGLSHASVNVITALHGLMQSVLAGDDDNRVRAAIGKVSKLTHHGLYDSMRQWNLVGEYEALTSGDIVRARDATNRLIKMSRSGEHQLSRNRSAYYFDAAARHQSIELDLGQPASVRYRSHYIAHALIMWASSDSSVDALVSLVRTLVAGTFKITRRHMSTQDVHASTQRWITHVETHRGIGARSFGRMVADSIIPHDWAERSAVLEGAESATAALINWFATDFVVPEARSEAQAERIVVDYERPAALGVDIANVRAMIAASVSAGSEAAPRVIPDLNEDQLNELCDLWLYPYGTTAQKMLDDQGDNFWFALDNLAPPDEHEERPHADVE